MEEFESIESLANGIKNKFNSRSKSKKILAVYAFNATGKTRLSNLIESDKELDNDIKILRYDSFFEDIFSWRGDGDSNVINLTRESRLIKLIIDEGLETRIAYLFKEITQSKIEPDFHFDDGLVLFNYFSGDNESSNAIKISRGEEGVFKWCVFCSVLESAIASLNDKEESRSTDIFNNLEYIIIDDPVSSMDDTKIVTIAVLLSDLIKKLENKSVKFLITTHHALFFNVLVNSLKGEKGCNFKSFNLLKSNGIFELKEHGDSPFGYHLILKEIIENAILNDSIEKYHFNYFRNLLEKTSVFLGYNNWGDCLSGSNKNVFIRLLNLYSHNRFKDLETKFLSEKEKEIFKDSFNDFNKKYFHE